MEWSTAAVRTHETCGEVKVAVIETICDVQLSMFDRPTAERSY